MCLRRRDSQTLYVSDLIEPPTFKNPGYGKLQIGVYIAAVQDAIARRKQQLDSILQTESPDDDDGGNDQDDGGNDHGSPKGGRGRRKGNGKGRRGGNPGGSGRSLGSRSGIQNKVSKNDELEAIEV